MSKNNELLSLLTRRIKGTADLIKDKDADALLVFNRANYRYLTNFTGEEAQLIITKNGDRVLLSDSRFAPQIEAQAVGELKVVMKHGHEAAEIAAEVKKLGVKKLLVEAEFVSAYEYDAIKSQLPDVDLVMAAEIVERVRNVKDDLELATLKKAVEISERAFEEVLPMLKPGAKERDVGAKLDYLFKLYGGDGPGYDSIIASGPRSSWAHGVASDRLMQEHELVVIITATPPTLPEPTLWAAWKMNWKRSTRLFWKHKSGGLPPLLPGQLARTLTRQPGATSMTPATGNTSAMGLATGSAWKSMKCVSRNFCSARRPWKTGLCTRLNQASTCRKAGSGSKMIFWLMATLRKFCPLCQRTNSFTCKIIFMVKFSVYWYNLRCRNGGFTR